MKKVNLTAIVLLLFLTIAIHAQQTPALRFAVMGDTGTGESKQYEIANQLEKTWKASPFELVLMVGDNLYGSEAPKDFVNKFEKPYQRLLQAGVKFYAALGNHDDPALQRTYKHFHMEGERYYTIKPHDGIRIFALDSNYMDKEQLEWLEKELKASGSGWKIVFFHHPIYSSGEKHGSNVELRTYLEPLFVKYGVDVVFTGHEHFYERLKAQKNIQYFIVGSSAKLRKGNIGKTPLTAKGFDTDNVFLVAEIAGDQMRFKTISRKGELIDSGSFRRAEKRPTSR
jgi:predicted phosphodiesterase